MASKLECYIELLEEGEKANIYSIRFEDEEETELEKFFLKYPKAFDVEFNNDIDFFYTLTDRIKQKGAKERLFRPESTRYGDGVGATPTERNRFRLYSIRITDEIIIFGNGAIKEVQRWQDDPYLTKCVRALIELKEEFDRRVNDGRITISDKDLTGDLTFYLTDLDVPRIPKVLIKKNKS